jgi:hypothetical protein
MFAILSTRWLACALDVQVKLVLLVNHSHRTPHRISEQLKRHSVASGTRNNGGSVAAV